MTPTTAEDFPRAFSHLWSARDASGLAALMVEDADFLSLTGGCAEGRKAITSLLRDELAGAFNQSRLVTGKIRLRALGPGAAVLHQRFVLSGLVDASGRDAGRVGAILIAVLVAKPGGWQAISLQFSPVEA
ncbi:SgcJ/EcaC family oxidoreductase [Pseudorhodobacter sp.]|uniref:SgcJ/EcaC family oxidoreductase n=1 Tax=Pseudorhodobacter sp. TaxID=1934400 RepID=UPI0026486408|nr:SgcJ/EcaC family oxidoreductase [Pseudorhodobacter sp.]MDN5788070.1 SgcJ/EcaC family oxidoreductase [Pseudorhodobacter sp.]